MLIIKSQVVFSFFPYLPASDLLSTDQLVPASHSPSQPSSSASSRAHSPRHTSSPLEPPILHTRVGGAAWTLDMPGWVKTSGVGVGVGGGESKRGSKIDTNPASRKSSLTFADPKYIANTRGQIGHETSQQIWAATHDAVGVGATHRSLEKEAQDHSSERLAEPNKRLSLNSNRPFLRAHATESRIGVATGAGAKSSSGTKQKRASMPPLQNHRRPSTLAGGSAGSSRRGSLAHSIPPSQPIPAHAMRNRSQSLPCDSLFLAYASCALPAVMTSSLANMPIPTQPAIPVKVARRYSVLSMDAAPHAHGGAMSEPTSAASATPGSDDEVLNVDPREVEGIDTSSTLDTSYLQDMAPLDEDDDEDEDDDGDGVDDADTIAGDDMGGVSGEYGDGVEESLPLNLSKSRVSAGQSNFSTPLGSPVGDDEIESLSFPFMADIPSSQLSAGSSLTGVSASFNMPLRNTVTGDSSAVSGVTNRPVGVGGVRSRSVIHSTLRNGVTIHTPTLDQDLSSTPDYTPMTSPTNLSNIIFKQTLMTRRMSEVVAKDIGRKLKILKRHMQEETMQQ